MPSGLGAIAGSLYAFLKAGDHLLMTDTAYFPTRKLCDQQLAKIGVTTTYYDPMIGAEIEKLIQPNTRVIYMESPGSHTFEIQDVPAIAAVAKARGIVTMIDNTWASPLFFKPLRHGVDLSLHAATKYIVGHSDVMMGIIAMKEEHFMTVKTQVHGMGYSVGPDDVYLALRGLRTMSARLAQHQQTALPPRRLAAAAAGGRARAAPRPPGHARSRVFQARLHRLVRPVQHRPEALLRCAAHRHARRHAALRHGLFLGRL